MDAIIKKPGSKTHLYEEIVLALRERFDDPTVEIQIAGRPNFIRIRVQEEWGAASRSFRYYRINVVEER